MRACTSLYAILTLGDPFVRLQHQVLLGLLQLVLQTLVLGSDFTDSLLAVLQQAKLGADVQQLLTDACGDGQRAEMDLFLLSREAGRATPDCLSAAVCLTFTQVHTFTPHRLPV